MLLFLFAACSPQNLDKAIDSSDTADTADTANDTADDTANDTAPPCDPLTVYADADGDGYAPDDATPVQVDDCVIPEGKTATQGDCDDGRVRIHPGAFGTQFSDATDVGRVTKGEDIAFGSTDAFTMDFTIKFSAGSAGHVIMKGAPSGFDEWIFVWTDADLAYVEIGGADDMGLLSVVSLEEWHDLSVVYDAGAITVVADGDSTTGAALIGVNTDAALTFGNSGEATGAAMATYDRAAIIGRALSEAELSALHSGTTSYADYSADAAAIWYLDVADATTVTDMSGLGHDIVLTGTTSVPVCPE